VADAHLNLKKNYTYAPKATKMLARVYLVTLKAWEILSKSCQSPRIAKHLKNNFSVLFLIYLRAFHPRKEKSPFF